VGTANDSLRLLLLCYSLLFGREDLVLLCSSTFEESAILNEWSWSLDKPLCAQCHCLHCCQSHAVMRGQRDTSLCS